MIVRVRRGLDLTPKRSYAGVTWAWSAGFSVSEISEARPETQQGGASVLLIPCRKCRAQISDQDGYCSHCGSPQPPAPTGEVVADTAESTLGSAAPEPTKPIPISPQPRTGPRASPVACVVYTVLAVWLLLSIILRAIPMVILGLAMLIAMLWVINAWGLRQRILSFKSPVQIVEPAVDNAATEPATSVSPSPRTRSRYGRLLVTGYVIGYVLVGFWLLASITAGSLSLEVFGLLMLTVLLLVSNPRGIRQQIPGFRSPNWRAAAGSWIGLLVGGVALTAIAAATLPSASGQPVPATKSVPTSEVLAVAVVQPTAPPAKPTPQPMTMTPVVVQVLATATPIPPITTPTPGAAEFLALVDSAWPKGDWPAAVAALESLQKVAPDAVDFKDKLYVAQYSWGKSLLETGDKAGAASHFFQAYEIDRSRSEAWDELLALTPTPTPRPPTATPVLPTATLAPTSTPQPISLSGRGQTATNPVTPLASLSVITLTHNGQANFIVHAVSGSQDISLVNAIGPYRGQRPLIGNQPVVFDIRADGAWTIRIDPIQFGGSPAFQGTGDAVSPLFTPPSNGPWEISHNGQANFIVHLYCRDGEATVQNAIGPVQGSRLLRFGQAPCFWEVRADGAWSLKPR